MPIDSANKRYSLIGLLSPTRRMLPVPDGGFAAQGDRQELEYLYAGVLSAVTVTLFDGLTTSIRLTGVGH